MISLKDLLRNTAVPQEELERIVIPLLAYFDDAGTDSAATFTVCAGYLATATKWRSFELKWKQLLRSYEIRDEKFSMKAWSHLKGDFRKWNEHKKRSFMNSALSLVASKVEVGFAAAVRKVDYQQNLSTGVKSKIGGEFQYCAHAVVAMAEKYAAERSNRDIGAKPREDITYIFEEGTTGLGYLQDTLEQSYNAQFLRYRHFSRADKTAYPLHASDIMSYELRKFFTDLDSGVVRFRHPFKELLGGVQHWLLGLDGNELKVLDSELRSVNWII